MSNKKCNVQELDKLVGKIRSKISEHHGVRNEIISKPKNEIRISKESLRQLLQMLLEVETFVSLTKDRLESVEDIMLTKLSDCIDDPSWSAKQTKLCDEKIPELNEMTQLEHATGLGPNRKTRGAFIYTAD